MSRPPPWEPGHWEPGHWEPGRWPTRLCDPGQGEPGHGRPGSLEHCHWAPKQGQTGHRAPGRGKRTENAGRIADLRGYKVSWLTADSVAGLTLVAIAIPEQVATAHLANMPAVTGFYAFVAGSVLFTFIRSAP